TSISLTIENSNFKTNTSANGGGAIFNSGASTSDSEHKLIVRNSTFTENTATANNAYGGAIANAGASSAGGNNAYAEIYNSKFEHNSAAGAGGAIGNTGN